uniref:Uncharacterized protein n=1 Tax=Anguilla anguilla TaxID=7936 RepID=A0A0E9PJZ0_ANGAN
MWFDNTKPLKATRLKEKKATDS